MEWIIAGLAFGFLGSFHCVGMCGPIALSLPGTSARPPRFVATRMIYNIGRVITYSILGALVGLFGRIIALGGYQQALSIGVGTLLLLTLFWPRLRSYVTSMESFPAGFVGKVTGRIKKLFGRGSFGALFLIGILNGFLPCGFVYMALATAVTFGAVEGSTLFMAGFGMGTIPAMLGISLAGSLVSADFRLKLQKLSPFFIAAVGALLILRGLNLGIPFVSPVL